MGKESEDCRVRYSLRGPGWPQMARRRMGAISRILSDTSPHQTVAYLKPRKQIWLGAGSARDSARGTFQVPRSLSESLLSDSQRSCDYYKSRSSRVARKQIWDLYSTYTKSTSYVTGLPSGWNDYDALSGTLTRGLGNAAARIGYSSPSLQTSCCFPWLAISLSCEQPPALRPQASGRPSSP